MITLAAPPSKSLSHRMLIGAALAEGESLLSSVLESDDILRTCGILQAAGAHIRTLPDGILSVRGVSGTLRGGTQDSPLSCNVHESGTTCRLLTAVLAAGQGYFRIHGAPRMHERPLGGLADALQSVDVELLWEQREGYPPLILNAHGMTGGQVRMSLKESSQYLSALLLAAPLCRAGLSIELDGGTASWPYVGLTLQCLEDFGVPFEIWDGERRAEDFRARMRREPGEVRFVVPPAAYRAGTFTVDGDWSGASYFLAAGAVGSRAICVTNLRTDSLQGDRALLDILRLMGADIMEEKERVTVRPSRLRGVEIDMCSCPDLVPTAAVLAAFAEWHTGIKGTAHLRLKESDRIAAPARNLRAVGITVEEYEDGLGIEGGTPCKASLFHAFGDHRIAMSAALLGLRHGKIALDDPHVVRKSFPEFWKLWERVLTIP